MPFDALTMAAVADDVKSEAVGGRVQKIIQPAPLAVGLAIYKDGSQHWLMLSADAQQARVVMLDGPLAKAYPTPSSFIMLLRKHLGGSRLLEALQPSHERVLRLTFRHASAPISLAAEVMGKHSNIILIDASERILGAVKIVPARASRVRPVLPGHQYEPPPLQERDLRVAPPGKRVDPSREPGILSAALRASVTGATTRSVLLGILAGCSPFLADQIALRAGVAPSTPVEDVDREALIEAAQSMYELYQSRAWAPATFQDARARPDFAPYLPLAVEGVESASTISEAIDRATGSRGERDALQTVRSEVLAAIERRRERVERRLASLRAGLEAAGQAEEAMQRGRLILAYQYAIKPRESTLVIPELDTRISLDPALSAADNAERAFRRYRKLREARVRIPPMIEAAAGEAAVLDETRAFVAIARTERHLRDLRREVLGEPGPEPGKKSKERRRGPPRFKLDGFTATVGRSARENEEVTFRLAARNDLWLHARERTGAHVVLHGETAPPEEVIGAAAALAAHFSDARADTRVSVDVAAVRDVRRIPGSAPGRVTYRNFRTITVEPSMGGWEPIDRRR